MEIVRYNGSNDWSALYIDGKLVIVGDHYLSDEKISEILGVTEVLSNDFMGGSNSLNDVLRTIEEVEAYSAQKEQDENQDSMLALAEKLEKEAKRLRQQAASS